MRNGKSHELRIREIIRNIKECVSCSVCGESHPACLDFHHREGKNKLVNISQIHSKGWSIVRVIAEIEKCDILCANCHRKIHHKERIGNNYRP
jgi:hypothetical protein